MYQVLNTHTHTHTHTLRHVSGWHRRNTHVSSTEYTHTDIHTRRHTHTHANTHTHTHSGMLAGGTGATPMYQVLNAILKNPADKTKVRRAATLLCTGTHHTHYFKATAHVHRNSSHSLLEAAHTYYLKLQLCFCAAVAVNMVI